MKRMLSLLLLCAMMCAAFPAFAVTLRTFTPFADMDFAAQAYMDLITAWEEQTGSFVEDYSGVTDGQWLAQLTDMARAGEADIVIVPVGSGLTMDELVTAQELSEAAPQLNIRAFTAMAEADGSVLLTPIRLNWEALYVNTDVLAAHGVNLPTTLEDLTSVCARLSDAGVLPIANALYDWSEIVLDCAALMGAPDAVYASKESLDGAADVLAMLNAVGAFGSNPRSMTDTDAMECFLSGQAAMRFDSDFLAYDIPEERFDLVAVIAPPMRSGTVNEKIVGTPGFGLAITRSCFEDEAKREAAISLCEKLLTEAALVSPAGGTLGEDILRLTETALDCTGLLYDADPDRFDAWAESTVSVLEAL